jgi:hypothetical protein
MAPKRSPSTSSTVLTSRRDYGTVRCVTKKSELSWGAFIKNLTLVAPNKGEAKKSVSGGRVRLEFQVVGSNLRVAGLATDDHISISSSIVLTIPEARAVLDNDLLRRVMDDDIYGEYPSDALKEPRLGAPGPPDKEFDRLFWREHVWSSIFSDAPSVRPEGFAFNPERLRKLALLEPREEMSFHFVDWADRSIIRWTAPLHAGVYAPTGMW